MYNKYEYTLLVKWFESIELLLTSTITILNVSTHYYKECIQVTINIDKKVKL